MVVRCDVYIAEPGQPCFARTTIYLPPRFKYREVRTMLVVRSSQQQQSSKVSWMIYAPPLLGIVLSRTSDFDVVHEPRVTLTKRVRVRTCSSICTRTHVCLLYWCLFLIRCITARSTTTPFLHNYGYQTLCMRSCVYDRNINNLQSSVLVGF